MKNNSKISVLMNCFNSEIFIKESVQSLVNQTYTNWELIVWDDASTDGTLDILKCFKDNRIKIYTNSSHCGLGSGRIKAQKFLKGDYISILDSDDVYEKDKLRNQIEAFNRNHELSLVTSWYSTINKNSKQISKIKLSNNLSEIKNELCGDNIFAHSSIMYKRIDAEKVGWYSEKFEYSQDYDLTIKLLKNNSFYIVPDYLVKIRDIDSSMTRNSSLHSLIIKEHLEILNYIKNDYILNKKQKKINDKNLNKVNLKILLFNLQKKCSFRKIFDILNLLFKNPSLVVSILKHISSRFINF
jgi:glycosyltransferase involved in cell wall biosynthesis